MKRSGFGFLVVAILSLSVASCSPPPAVTRPVLQGAGSSFAAPLFKKWKQEYEKSDATVVVEYDSVGSGEGQVRFLAAAVDFAASEAPLTSEQMDKVERGTLMVPLAAGSVVLAYNPQDIADGLKFPRDVYVDIFLGRIKSWDDPRIAAANPGVSLPNREIRPIVRLDSSGTTYAFTSHLAAISDEWRISPGAGKIARWPNEFQQERGNERVAGAIKLGAGTIGYVEFGTARAAGLHMARLENKRGEFIKPSIESTTLALANVGYEAEQLAALQDPDVPGGYPIVTCVWLMVYKHYTKSERAEAVRSFVSWSLTKGQQYCDALGYIPLSPTTASNAVQSIDQLGL